MQRGEELDAILADNRRQIAGSRAGPMSTIESANAVAADSEDVTSVGGSTTINDETTTKPDDLVTDLGVASEAIPGNSVPIDSGMTERSSIDDLEVGLAGDSTGSVSSSADEESS